jgi:mono/diheme cytochrome c family protein
MAKTLAIVLGFVLIAALGTGLWVASSGFLNVAATQGHSDLIRWLLATVRDQSIKAGSRSVSAPDLSDARLAEKGFQSYHTMCIVCHAPPGRKPSSIRQGLNPRPPYLYRERTQQRSDAELFWIVKHGIKMTGMPAFGPTHSDDDLWAVVAFLRRLPKLSPGEYAKLVKAAGLPDKSETHPASSLHPSSH